MMVDVKTDGNLRADDQSTKTNLIERDAHVIALATMHLFFEFDGFAVSARDPNSQTSEYISDSRYGW